MNSKKYFRKINDRNISSCFLEDIDPKFKISEIIQTDLHHLSVPVFSKCVPKIQNVGFPKSRDF